MRDQSVKAEGDRVRVGGYSCRGEQGREVGECEWSGEA